MPPAHSRRRVSTGDRLGHRFCRIWRRRSTPEPDDASTFNEPGLMFHAAADGLGVAYVLEYEAADWLASGRLIRLLDPPASRFPRCWRHS
ncbi:hypothetical protein DF142_31760 [Burkholderia cenocepacia]|nr:hypothetical protein DF142_31760 [Burkholderia cenocepacia]RQU55208.1 hypothetical protein DF140_34940 [Burkholderia cenocepacia]